jgi:membrane fusion protein (multidrug efflux system)
VNQDAKTSVKAQQAAKNGAARRRWIALLILLVLTVGGVLGYWRYAAIYPSTDNAYTGADIVRIAPLVSGSVTDVYVADDQKVSAGDPLFDIDPAPYEAALRGARAQFDAAANAAGTAAEDMKKAADEMEAKRVALVEALGTYREADAAQGEGEAPSQATIDALKAVNDAQAAYKEAHEAFSKAQDEELVITTPTSKLRGAAAQLDKATEDRVKTHVVSPGDGWVAKVRVRPGAVMQAGTPAFPLIESGDWWVDANFKETDLARIKPGQPASIKLDMYPGYKISGTVESISPGSGAIFSVLPPENATGNWVKITQRFPVRLKITSAHDPKRPLRVGATATVTVDTTKTATGSAAAEVTPDEDANAKAANAETAQ